MKLTLDHTQRLNIHALIGAQRGSVDEVRAFWKLQDQLDLTKEEKEKISYKMVGPEGQQTPTWSFTGMPAKEFNFDKADSERIKKVVKEWQQGFVAAPDRRWLEPLLDQLEEVEKPQLVAKAN